MIPCFAQGRTPDLLPGASIARTNLKSASNDKYLWDDYKNLDWNFFYVNM